MGNEPKGGAPAPAAGGKSSIGGLDENIASLLCYLLGPIAIIFFVLEKESKTVKFHAFQAFLTAWVCIIGNAIISIVLHHIPVLGWILSTIISLAIFLFWVYLIYKAYQGEKIKLPVVGDIAETQANK